MGILNTNNLPMKRILFIAAMALSLASCSIYHPQTVDIPLLHEPNETRVDAALGVSTFLFFPDAITFGGTVSHAFNGWAAGQLHANAGTGTYYVQAAPGAYLPLGSKGVLEGYVGAGYGGTREHTISNNDSTGSSSSYGGHYALPFAQMNIGWRDLGPVELAFGIKTGALLPDYTYTKYSPDSSGTLVASHERYRDGNLLFEPQFQFRIGSERVKYTLRLSWSWLSDLGQTANHFVYDHFTISNGLVFTF